ncbi:MAG: general secretion pathway protein GspD [Deltaproteobacteria bacterium]|nr:MAG: general secretion pathway protein GspD [Deltaproteobacteria bacterium]
MRPFARRLCVLLLSALIAGCATERLRRESVKAFEQGAYEEAIANLEEAVRNDPSNLELRLELRLRLEAAVQQLITAADRARANGDRESAATSYRRVLTLEPGNDRALRGLKGVQADRRHAERTAKAEQLFAAKQIDAAELEVHAVLAEDPGFAAATALLSRIELARGPTSAVLRLKTRDERPVSLQFRDAPTKMVFEALARQTGLNFIFDKDVKSEGKTTIFVNQVPVEQAIDLILAQNQLGRQVLSENIALIYPNTAAKQKEYRDEIVHTFYLTNAAPKDAESLLKTVLGTKTLFVDEHSSTLVMRDTPEHVRMAEKLVASLDVPEPEVIMEVEVLEITHSLLEQLGINYPSNVSFSLTKPPNSEGAGTTGLVLGDIAKQNKNTISVSSLGVSVDLLKQVGVTNVLSSPRIRARNREKAKILVGNRLPVVTSGTSATVGGAFSTSNVQYIDAGLTLEVQPTIHNDGNVAIKISLEVSSIIKQISVPIGNGGTTLAYEIGTRNASTLLELKDGETQVLAGLIQDTDQRNSSHIPGLGDLPILGRLFGSNGTTRDKNEIVLSITPRLIRTQPRPSSETTEFWYGTESQTRSGPFASGAAAGSAPAGSGAAPVVPGGVSFGAGSAVGNAPAAPVSSGPRAVPSRIDAAARKPPAADAAAAAPPDAKAAASKPADTAAADATAVAQGAAADSRPQVTIEGPETAKVGDEVSVSVKLASTSPLGRIRTQVGFDASALQLVSAEPGDLAPSGETPKVETKPGGVQLELAGSEGAPVSGGGTLLNLRFRVVAARPAIAIATQVVLVGEDGVAVAATQATPLKIAVAR